MHRLKGWMKGKWDIISLFNVHKEIKIACIETLITKSDKNLLKNVTDLQGLKHFECASFHNTYCFHSSFHIAVRSSCLSIWTNASLMCDAATVVDLYCALLASVQRHNWVDMCPSSAVTKKTVVFLGGKMRDMCRKSAISGTTVHNATSTLSSLS